MEIAAAMSTRRMWRNFRADPVDPALVDSIIEAARRAPSAGNTSATRFLVLEGAQTAEYWDITLPDEKRPTFAWPGLLVAPVLVVILVAPGAYVSRYAEGDKSHTGLGSGTDAWAIPYWFVDGGMAAMSILLAVESADLGACFFGLFEHEGRVCERFGVPEGWRAVGTIALGYRAPDRPSTSSSRRRPALGEVIHRGRWGR